MAEKKSFKIDWDNIELIRDAVQMLKSVFIEKYAVYDYDELEIGAAWHKIKQSKKAHTLGINHSIRRYEAPDTEPHKKLPKAKTKNTFLRPDDDEEIAIIGEVFSKYTKKSDQMRALYDGGVTNVKRISELVEAHYSHCHSVIKKHTKE